ncbi:Liver-expressed antimicrobial peptide 2 [Labeo rohita]|uniref:Liver-expressed antimicrobial peptide 2 n=1 Tax=Labeo rohita TaxID=84645 RepID=A0ABQ8LKN1_LABRO|nr:Liver-expressed antimicrobial peptide 2 [Labeo rohita]
MALSRVREQERQIDSEGGEVSAVPIGTPEVQSDLQSSHILHRKIRMSPLWRIMGFKPYGAYCHDNIECTTGLCRNGHCSFNEPVHS